MARASWEEGPAHRQLSSGCFLQMPSPHMGFGERLPPSSTPHLDRFALWPHPAQPEEVPDTWVLTLPLPLAPCVTLDVWLGSPTCRTGG